MHPWLAWTSLIRTHHHIVTLHAGQKSGTSSCTYPTSNMKRSLEQLFLCDDEEGQSGHIIENMHVYDLTIDEHVTTRRKSSSGSDFSTFEISRALRTPSPLALPSHTATDPTSQCQTIQHDGTFIPEASSKVLFVDPAILEDLSAVPDLQVALPRSAPRCRGLQPLPHLQELLDFRQLNTPDWISYRFCQIAYSLLHHHHIEISTPARTERLQILDIEFYLSKSGCHEDPYTHRSYEQSRSGLWYFHRLGSPDRDCTFGPAKADYLSGVQAGLDLTFGQRADCARASTGTDLRGGILIRSVLRVSDGKVVHRPWEVVDEVLRLNGAGTVRDLTTHIWNCSISAFPPSVTATSTPPSRSSSMFLVRTAPSSVLPITKRDMVVSDGTRRIFRSARVELKLSAESSYALKSLQDSMGTSQPFVQLDSNSASVLARPDVHYFAAPYRFFVAPYLLHLRNTSWPRAQNFLGVHDAIIRGEDATDQELLLKEISRLTGLKFAQRYLTAFRHGREAEEQQRQDADSDLTPRPSSSAPVSTKGLTRKNMISDAAVEWLRVIATLRRLRARQESQTGSLANELTRSGDDILAHRRKSSSASDFSAFDISCDLGTPPPPAPLSITIHPLLPQHDACFQPLADITMGSSPTFDIPDLDFLEQDFAMNFDLPYFAPADFEPCEPLAPSSQSTQAQVGDVRNSIPDLAALLDFRDVDDEAAITFRFIQIAYYLLHHHRIEIRTATDTERLEILEVEFYLYKAGSHEDPYTHGSVEQGRSGQWYFRRKPSPNRDCFPASLAVDYDNGSSRGVELTIGPSSTPTANQSYSSHTGAQAMVESTTTSTLRGGILIRSMLRVSDGQVFCKPAAIVDEILRLSGADSIYDLAEHTWNGDLSAFPPQASRTWADPLFGPASSTMYIVRAEHSTSTVPITEIDVLFKHGTRRIFSSPRVGLDLSDLSLPHRPYPSAASLSSAAFGASSLPSDLFTHPRFQYVSRPYRFFLAPYLLVVNGGERAPTFLGVHDFLVGSNATGAQQATLSPELLEDVTRLTGMWGMNVRPYHKALSTARADPVHAEPHEGGIAVETGKGMRSVTANKADVLEWVGRDALSEVQWLRMIITLRRLRAHARHEHVTADSQSVNGTMPMTLG